MTPKNRLQIMQPVFGLQPGTILSIPDVAKHLQLDFEEFRDDVYAVVQGFIESDILAEIFPKCFVTETRAGGNPFLLVYTHIIDDVYVCNIAGFPYKHFKELVKDQQFQSFYADEPWSNEFKAYLQKQNAKPCFRVPYSEPIPMIQGEPGHAFAGYIYTGNEIHIVDGEFNVSKRRLKVLDLFDGTTNTYRAAFTTQAKALEYAAYYTNPENQPKRRCNNLRNIGEMMNICGSDTTFEEVTTPADQKRFSLNDINRCWDRFPGFDGSPYAQQLKQHFMDNALAKMI